MGLIDNQGVVFAEKSIVLNFCQQNTIGHQFDGSFGRTLVGKAHLIAHGLTQGVLSSSAMRSGHGAGCNSPRLGMANNAFDTAPGLEADFGQLGGFTGAGFAGNHHDLMVAN